MLRVVGALVAHDVAGPADPTRRGELLQTGLVVPAAGTGHGLGDALAQTAQHEITGGREIAVEVDGGNNRFERVGENRLLRAPARAVTVESYGTGRITARERSKDESASSSEAKLGGG